VLISSRVAAGLEEIVIKVRRVDELMTEIAVASKEQNHGIGQINSAISQMEHVTQSNTACAEESASAAEELSAQAGGLKEAIRELITVIGTATTSTSKPKPKPVVFEARAAVGASPQSSPSLSVETQPRPLRHIRNGADPLSIHFTTNGRGIS